VDPKPDARAWIPERGTLNRIKWAINNVQWNTHSLGL
jgi:hypothetical protein